MSKEQERLELKAQAQTMILEDKDKSVYDIAKELGISKSAVARYKQELEQVETSKDVDRVANLDPKTLLAIANNLENTSPVLARNLVHLSTGLESMNKLEPVIHNALGDVVVMAQKRMQDKNLKTGEFKMLGELIIKTYATMYNRPSVEINMTQQNNKVVQNAVTERLNSLTRGIFPDEDVFTEVEE